MSGVCLSGVQCSIPGWPVIVVVDKTEEAGSYSKYEGMNGSYFWSYCISLVPHGDEEATNVVAIFEAVVSW